MKKTLLLLVVSAFGMSCGAPATNTSTTNANKPANSASNANSMANTSSAANSTTAASNANSVGNPELDFALVNKTGYDIKKLYVGRASEKNWTNEDEILHGKTLADGATLEVKFSPRAKAAKWDIMVEWADGSPNEEWLNLDLTQIEKITLHYDKAKDVTRAEIQ